MPPATPWNQGCSKVRPVEGRSCSAALKSEDRRPKPERRPKSEFREWPNSIGCSVTLSRQDAGVPPGAPAWCRLTATGLSGVAIHSDFGLRVSFGLRASGLGFGMARTDFRAALRDGRGADWRGGDVVAAGLPSRRRADGAGEPLAGERQGHPPVDDGIHPARALRRAPRESLAGSAVVSASLERVFKPVLLGRLHAHRPVELKVMVLAKGCLKLLRFMRQG